MYTHLSRKKCDYFVVDGFLPLVVGKSRVKVSFGFVSFVVCLAVVRSVAHRSTENSMLSNFTLHKALHTLSLTTLSEFLTCFWF